MTQIPIYYILSKKMCVLYLICQPLSTMKPMFIKEDSNLIKEHLLIRICFQSVSCNKFDKSLI